MSAAPHIEVLFSTHNGTRTLPRMLAALERLEPSRGAWRILAVDNASTDDTSAILADAARRLPLEPLSCPEPGKMPALKLAIARASAPLLVFTDDDVEPIQGWLAAYERAAADHPDVGLFGGPIAPTPVEPTGPWFEASAAFHAELFARSDEPDGPVDAAARLYGPNFMIRREHADVFDAVSAGLGPIAQAKSFAMGEDTEIMQLLARRGVAARYVRGASVRHLVRSFQTDLPAMLARAERHGRGAAIRWVEEGGRSPARRARLMLNNAVAWARWRSKAPAGAEPSATAFEALWQARWSLGAVKGAAFGPYR